MSEKSDKQVLVEIFTKRGLGYDIDKRDDLNEIELISGEHENVGGYMGFSAVFEFDEEDNLKQVNLWE